MRLTILAGLIMGLSLAIHSVLVAHAKVGHAVNAVRVPAKEVAPWYVAMDDAQEKDAPKHLIV